MSAPAKCHRGKVSALIPCYNEGQSIQKVVGDFQNAIGDCDIYVYDNNSSDDTVERALAAGATVRSARMQGKGNVVRCMFADIDSDIYLMVDGDDTYDASYAQELIDLLVNEHLDMVVGARVTSDREAYRVGHRFGNQLLRRTVSFLFGRYTGDMLSGYRVFSRRFVKSFPAFSPGFEIETELTVHALSLGMGIGEVPTRYKSRGCDSASKLRTYRDGFRILIAIVSLFKDERPLLFFSCIFLALISSSLVLAYPLFATYYLTGLVPRFPTAILATGLVILSFLSLACGLILDTVTKGRRELRRLFYLSSPFLKR